MIEVFWPDRPWPATLVSDVDAPDRHGGWDRIITFGRDLSWSKNLHTALGRTASSHVLLMQEDFFLSGKVDTAFIREAISVSEADKRIGCFRLTPCPGASKPFDGKRWGEHERGVPYRVSCMSAVWSLDYLARICGKTHGAADFEIQGTELSLTEPESVLAVNVGEHPIPHLASAISRGKWNPDALKLCNTWGVKVDQSRRLVDRPPPFRKI